jgi:hypothetical protein
VEPNLRAVVAFVAGRLISGRVTATVYDYSRDIKIWVPGIVDKERVHVYDCRGRGYFGGRLDAERFKLYHYGGRYHVTLEIHGGSFSGYDHLKQCHFGGRLDGSLMHFADYALHSYFLYAI